MIAGNYLGGNIYVSFNSDTIILTENDGETINIINLDMELFKALKKYGDKKFNINQDDDYPDGE